MIDMSQTGSWAFQCGPGRGPKRDEESQRVMGFPVDWSSGSGSDHRDRDQVRPLPHPIRGYKRWLRRRRLGPYAVDEDQP